MARPFLAVLSFVGLSAGSNLAQTTWPELSHTSKPVPGSMCSGGVSLLLPQSLESGHPATGSFLSPALVSLAEVLSTVHVAALEQCVVIVC